MSGTRSTTKRKSALNNPRRNSKNKNSQKRQLTKGIIVGAVTSLALIALIATVIFAAFPKSEFDKKCKNGIRFSDGMSFSCAEIKNHNLEDAYLNAKIVKHGSNIYERETSKEVEAGKQNGFYCLSAKDTWQHIGELRCVVFKPASLVKSGYNYFLNEKEDYKTGFVLFMPEMYINWDAMNKTLTEENPEGLITACGEIKLYEGHPEIVFSQGKGGITMLPNLGANEFARVNGESIYSYKCTYWEARGVYSPNGYTDQEKTAYAFEPVEYY